MGKNTQASDFGIVADGVTDDTAALQAAIDSHENREIPIKAKDLSWLLDQAEEAERLKTKLTAINNNLKDRPDYRAI